jgi:hypothetical protein
MGPEASIPLPHQAMGELLRLPLKSLHHGGLNIFIQPGSNASETWRPHTHMDITGWNRSGLYGWWTASVSTQSMSSPQQYRHCLDGHGCATLHLSWACQTLSWAHVNVFEGSTPALFIDGDFRVLQHSVGKGLWFQLDKVAKAAVVQSLQQQPRELFMEVIHQLVCWMDNSLNAHGDYLVARIIHIRTVWT